jgi:hypothetical protein
MKNNFHAHRTYTSEEISDWISRYRSGGLGLGAFADQHRLPRARLHYWVYGRRNSPAREPSASAPIFQELKLTAGLPTQNWAAEISLPTGTVARFSAAATPVWINSVMETLRRPC